MNILHEDAGNKGKFYIKEEDALLAELTYVWSGDDKFIIDHTEVSDKLKGTGAGKKLIEAAVNFARKSKVKILPLCPFANAVFNKTP